MSKQKFIAIKNQADSDTLELFFLDVIQDSFDWWTGMMSSKVQEIIDKVNFYKPSRIKCVIDSVGGDAQTGLAIYNFLKRCDAKIEVEVIGLAGSIASVIAMAANKGKLRMARNAFMMIHKAEGVVAGTSDEIRQGAELVDLYTSQIVDVYSQRTGKTVDEINALIKNGDYWMTGQQAVEQGFADDTFNDVTENLQIAARLDPNVYKNIPAHIKAQLESPADEDSKTFIQNQFDQMKKFFTEIVNAIKGVKPEEGKTITNQIADAVTAPFEKVGEEIENQITEKVKNATGDEFVTTVANKAVSTIDFSKDGAPKTAVENSVKTFVENSLKATDDNEVKKYITNSIKTAVDAATAELKQKNSELEQEITNMKGGRTNSGNNGGTEEVKTVGSFK